jgi:hypothetical protein
VVKLPIVDNPPLVSIFTALCMQHSFVWLYSVTITKSVTLIIILLQHISVIHFLVSNFAAFSPPVLFMQMITGSCTYHVFMLPIHEVKIKVVLSAAGILCWLLDKPLQVAFTKATKNVVGAPVAADVENRVQKTMKLWYS